MAPMKVVDYVVVHELAHIAELNHSKKFWDTVKIMLPEYRQTKAWLKQNRYQLEI
jgi:predicted metal-dependent hydrolase